VCIDGVLAVCEYCCTTENTCAEYQQYSTPTALLMLKLHTLVLAVRGVWYSFLRTQHALVLSLFNIMLFIVGMVCEYAPMCCGDDDCSGATCLAIHLESHSSSVVLFRRKRCLNVVTSNHGVPHRCLVGMRQVSCSTIVVRVHFFCCPLRCLLRPFIKTEIKIKIDHHHHQY
jgi:hypothetical protein